MAPRDEVTIKSYEIDRPTSDVHDFYRNYTAVVDGKAEQLIKNWEVRRVLRVMEEAFVSSEKKQIISTNI